MSAAFPTEFSIITYVYGKPLCVRQVAEDFVGGQSNAFIHGVSTWAPVKPNAFRHSWCSVRNAWSRDPARPIRTRAQSTNRWHTQRILWAVKWSEIQEWILCYLCICCWRHLTSVYLSNFTELLFLLSLFWKEYIVTLSKWWWFITRNTCSTRYFNKHQTSTKLRFFTILVNPNQSTQTLLQARILLLTKNVEWPNVSYSLWNSKNVIILLDQSLK